MQFLGLIALHTFAQADNSIKVIDNPGGGQIVYGTIDNQNTPQSAMAFMLHTVHGHFDDRPQVSKVFQVRNSDSYAAFFTLIAKNQGNKPIAGEVIITIPKGGQPVAAVLYDDAQRFTRSQPILMKKLSTAWHASNAVESTDSTPASLASAQTLHMTTGGDRSATIGLPDGWHLLSVSGGQLTAEGPNSEKINLGIIIGEIHDPHSLQNQRVPPLRGAGPTIVCSASGDLFSAYVSVINQVRQSRNLPSASFKLTSSMELADGTGPAAIQAIFDVDLHDGKGLRSGSARIGVLYTRGMPTWAMTISSSSVPKTVAAAEASTMTAIIDSYSQDARVINGELQQKLGEIHAIGERSKIQAHAADQRRLASAAAFDGHMDDIDRASKAMQNYTLDRSQIQDNDLNGRATVSNGLADALIHANPDRYQIVPTASFLKGVDY